MNRKYPRATWLDYNSGIFFVTAVTKDRANYFGKIVDGDVRHFQLGEVLSRAIEECGLHYKGVSVTCYVVMPNHFHAIICVDVVGSRHAAACQPLVNFGCLRAPAHPEETDNFAARNHHNARLSVAIGGIKASVTKFANQNGIAFSWQANFHEHLIRDQREFDMIATYIETNPLNWEKDRFYRNI